MQKKRQLKVEILFDEQKQQSRILTWEGIVLVNNVTIEKRKIKNTKENRTKYANEYLKTISK